MKTKKIIILLFISFLTLQAKSQFYFEGGIKRGIWIHTKGINSVIDDYNISRPWLDEEMPHIRGGRGYRFCFGYQGNEENRFGVYFNIEAFRSIRMASGIDPESNKLVYDRLIVHFGGFGVGPIVCISHTENFDLQIGMDLNAFHYFVIRTQRNSTPDFKFGAPYSDNEAYNDYNPTVNFFIRAGFFAGPFGIVLTPKIDLPIYGRNELSEVGRTWPNTITTLPGAYMRAFNLSLSASIVICPKHKSHAD